MVPMSSQWEAELLNYDTKLALCTTKQNEQSEGKAGSRGCGVQLIIASFIKE